jgi:hypothetical protein
VAVNRTSVIGDEGNYRLCLSAQRVDEIRFGRFFEDRCI